MQDDRAGTPWKQITLFLITLGVLILCALLLRPFFSAIVLAIVLAVVTQRPYDWLASKIKNRSLCAAIALILIVLAVIIPTFFLAQELGQQALNTVNAFRNGAHQEKITSYIANRPALASRIELDDSIDPFEYCTRFGDPLPVIPPTVDRVDRMLAGCSLAADEVVALIPPNYGAATVEKIAANAVMAGCKPEMMRVLIPLVRAVCGESAR